MGFIDFTNGEVLTADQMDTVMRQGIMRFADASARDTALSAVLAEGMMAYLDDTDEVLKYDGTNWIDISGDITGVTAGTALTGGGTSGNVTLDVDESALTIAQSQVTDLTTDLADKQDDVITTQGDLVIGDASGDPVRLAIGSADQVLTSDGTTMTWEDAGGGGGFDILASGNLSNSLQITNIDSSYRTLFLTGKDFVTTGSFSNFSIKFLNGATTLDHLPILDFTGVGSYASTSVFTPSWEDTQGLYENRFTMRIDFYSDSNFQTTFTAVSAVFDDPDEDFAFRKGVVGSFSVVDGIEITATPFPNRFDPPSGTFQLIGVK